MLYTYALGGPPDLLAVIVAADQEPLRAVVEEQPDRAAREQTDLKMRGKNNAKRQSNMRHAACIVYVCTA